jgi:hypothetical protein
MAGDCSPGRISHEWDILVHPDAAEAKQQRRMFFFFDFVIH